MTFKRFEPGDYTEKIMEKIREALDEGYPGWEKEKVPFGISLMTALYRLIQRKKRRGTGI